MADNWIRNIRSNTLEKRLLTDMEKGIFTDVTFRVGPEKNRRTFQAHRLVLASENSEFEKLINGSDESEEIKVPDVHPKAFENLVRYCYGADILFKDLASIRETYLAAKKFKAKELQTIAEDNLIDILKSESLIKVLNVCIELNISRAKEKCLEAIPSRLEEVLNAEELILVPLEIMEAILSLCSDRGVHLKISAIHALLKWTDRHGCEDTILCRLLSMIQHEDIPSDEVLSSFRSKGVQLIESKFQMLSQVWSPLKNTALEDTKAESSKVGEETSLGEKVFTGEVKESGLKDENEIGVNTKETPEVGDEKTNNAGNDFVDDYGVIEEEVINDVIKESSDLIRNCLTCSSEETVERLINAIVEVTNHAADSMQETIDDMVNSFKYLAPCNGTTSKNTKVPSSEMDLHTNSMEL